MEELYCKYDVMYKDNLFIIYKLQNRDITFVDELNNYDKTIKVGDVIEEYIDADKKSSIKRIKRNNDNKNCENDISEFFIVQKIDKKYLYLIKNGEKTQKKIIKDENNEKINQFDIVFLDNNKIVKSEEYTNYFQEIITKKNAKNFRATKFILKRMVIHSCRKNMVCLYNVFDFKEKVYIYDYEIEPFSTEGQLYTYIDIGNVKGYVFEFKNWCLFGFYDNLFNGENIDTINRQAKEGIEIKSISEEEYGIMDAKIKKSHKKPIKEIGEDEIVITRYFIEEIEDSQRPVARMIDSNDNDYEEYMDKLPRYAHEGQLLALIHNKTTNTDEYRYLRSDNIDCVENEDKNFEYSKKVALERLNGKN